MLLQIPQFTFNCHKCFKIFPENMKFQPRGSRFDRLTCPQEPLQEDTIATNSKIIIRLSRCFGSLLRATKAHWTHTHMWRYFLQNYIMLLLAHFMTLFKVKCLVIGAIQLHSVLSETYECESGNTLLCWLLYVAYHRISEMECPVNVLKPFENNIPPTLNWSKTLPIVLKG